MSVFCVAQPTVSIHWTWISCLAVGTSEQTELKLKTANENELDHKRNLKILN